MKTKMQAGNLVAVYIDDPMGRRLVLAKPDPSPITGAVHAAVDPILIGATQSEVREVIRVLRELMQELPEFPPAPACEVNR